MFKGVLYALLANLLFGLIYYFAVLLRPLEGEAMFGFRIVVVVPFILFVILLLKQQGAFSELLQKIRENPPLVLLILLLSFNTGVQLWLFLWAPNHGQALQVSIGYLLLPMVAAALGKIVFKEQFSRLKWAALACAFFGVAFNLWQSSISWATLVAGVGYPIYITLRRYFQINTLATFLVELLLLLPLACYYISQVDMSVVAQQNPAIYRNLALLAIVSGSAFMFYIASSQILPLNVSGLIGYVEPLVMLIISFILGEMLNTESYLLMGCLGIAITLLAFDGFTRQKKLHSHLQ